MTATDKFDLAKFLIEARALAQRAENATSELSYLTKGVVDDWLRPLPAMLRAACVALEEAHKEEIESSLDAEARAEEIADCHAELARYKETLDGLSQGRASAIATYLGGYKESRDINIFRHGMETVFNIIDSAAAKVPK